MVYSSNKVVEAILWYDVEGEAMLERLGFRAAPSEGGVELSREILTRFNLSRFDVCCFGAAAPQTAIMVGMLRDEGKDFVYNQ